MLENAKSFFSFVQINIKRCHSDGCDTRIRGIKTLGHRTHYTPGPTVMDASAIWYLQASICNVMNIQLYNDHLCNTYSGELLQSIDMFYMLSNLHTIVNGRSHSLLKVVSSAIAARTTARLQCPMPSLPLTDQITQLLAPDNHAVYWRFWRVVGCKIFCYLQNSNVRVYAHAIYFIVLFTFAEISQIHVQHLVSFYTNLVGITVRISSIKYTV